MAATSGLLMFILRELILTCHGCVSSSHKLSLTMLRYLPPQGTASASLFERSNLSNRPSHFCAPLLIDSEHFGGTQLNTDGRRPCCWKRCHVMLDDHTAGGIRRHLLDRHTNDLLPSNAGRSGTSGPIICRWRLENGHTCGGSYQSATTLSRHISSSHMRVGRVTCEWCQTEFSRKDALKRHQKDNCPCRPRGGKSL